jgi:hypothetical protein
VVFFGALDALALAVGAGLPVQALEVEEAGVGSMLGWVAVAAAVAASALGLSDLASGWGEPLPPDPNTTMPTTRPTSTAEMPAMRGIDRLGGLRTVGASCVAVRPAPVIISVDALVDSVIAGDEGGAPEGEDGVAVIMLGALGGEGGELAVG